MAETGAGTDGRALVWACLDGIEDDEGLREAATGAIEAGASCIVVPEGVAERMSSLARVRIVERRAGDLCEGGRKVGHVVTIDDPGDVGRATELLARGRLVLLETPDWTVIPLEDLVAARRGEDLAGRVLAIVATVEDARVALGALEHGVDGVAVRSADPGSFKGLVAGVVGMGSDEAALELAVGTVALVQELGLGDRACVDTVDMLREGEGLLVGSSSSGFVLVHGETIENPYAAVRPFRINAGAVHSYVLAPGGRTLYLSEASSGIQVLLVDRSGSGRPSHVGRLKIERRPLVLVEVEAGGATFNAILQNAETVRLVTPAGHASVSSLEAGQKVIVYTPPPAGDKEKAAEGPTGRHFGRAVPERIVET